MVIGNQRGYSMNTNIKNLFVMNSVSIILIYGSAIGFFTEHNIPIIIWIILALIGSILNQYKYKIFKQFDTNLKIIGIYDFICILTILIIPIILLLFKLETYIYNFLIYLLCGLVGLFILLYNRKEIRKIN